VKFTGLAAGLLLAGSAASLFAGVDFDVVCNGDTVGSVSVDSNGSGAIVGGFTSSVGGPPPTVAAAAAACDQDHFNWYQIVVSDNHPPKDANGNVLNPPYVDPPPGGYSNQWADALPWYWDEYPAPAGTANYDPDLQLSAQVTGDMLNFSDAPNGSAGTSLEFETWLVSVNADGSLDGFFDGFSWDWTNADPLAGNVVSNIQLIDGPPTEEEYEDLIGGFLTSVPEPSTWVLMVGALAGLAVGVRLRTPSGPEARG
jgi:hypothetical protein